MPRHPIPTHLRTCEIKRRVAAMMKAATEIGFEIGSVRMTPQGEITLLDKHQSISDSDPEAKWLGS